MVQGNNPELFLGKESSSPKRETTVMVAAPTALSWSQLRKRKQLGTLHRPWQAGYISSWLPAFLSDAILFSKHR